MILTILSLYPQFANRNDKLDPNFAEKIRRIRHPKARMAVVWAHCKGKMVCEPDDPKEEGADGEAEEGKKAMVATGCGRNQPVVRKEGDDDMKAMQPDKRLSTTSEMYTVFKKLSDHNVHLLGLSEEYARPEWMILTVMPVPPPPVRPSIALDGGAMRSEDDLTYNLGDIIKASANVRRCEQEGAPTHVITEYEQLLQFHVATYMDNDIAGFPQALQRSGSPFKAIHARLKGKEGRLRGNLMGYVLFNRQPSLHKMSMMSHRVKLMPYSTFRLNLSVTPPYNADSDGDEMNMHVPQSEETRAGLAQIAWLPCQIISPQANKPVMGIVQDTLCEYPSPKPLWTGKQILSLVIPRGINIHRSPDPKLSTPFFDDGILIENGAWFSVSSRRRLSVLLKYLKGDNNVKQMVVTGSKGSFINISQISVCVGQQSVEGRRIPFGFRHCTLPHFTKDDLSPESRGFVENSYLRGLTPQEFFFCAMAGHEGLIDTAVKTAETGYIQRRLVKALEDVIVCYDGTVRNSLGDLIQFVYGEDGMDGAFIKKQTIETFGLNDRDFEHNYRVDVTDPSGGFMQGVLQIGIDDSSLELQSLLDEEYKDRRLFRDFIFPRVPTTQPHYLPVNLQRIVQNAIQIFHIDRRKPSDLEPAYIIDSIRELGKRLIVVRGDDTLSVEAQENATLTFRMHLRATFAACRVLETFHLTREAFDWFVGEVETKFSKEIINVATNINTPSFSVYFNPEISASSKLARTFSKNSRIHPFVPSLRQSRFGTTRIWLLPWSIIPDDSVFVHAFFEIPDEEVESKMHLQSAWLLRQELDRAKMIDHKLSMQYVAGRIAESFKTDLFVICNSRCVSSGAGVKSHDPLISSLDAHAQVHAAAHALLREALRVTDDAQHQFQRFQLSQCEDGRPPRYCYMHATTADKGNHIKRPAYGVEKVANPLDGQDIKILFEEYRRHY
ncbi:hypothetical protein D9619_003904 [Psilocybe cf. subviscida]|uniref:DNA-directed RNA polymerase subunit n=1 Tax=Psilocybe cf. subviscida TaxID=2480587 RepID=A0A8H5F8Q6_9AGAR|nr:hypothetical protein D9619_003904 [Psilocybe cf. subviscida]